MRRATPPLNPLRCFEALVRLGTVGRAAEELSVTHGAVSHQIRALEEALGVSLFHREKRKLRPTQAGQVYAREVREAFRILAESTQRLALPSIEGRLRIACAPTLAGKWLVQEIGGFRALYPDIEVALRPHNLEEEEIAGDSYDVAIVYGSGDWSRRWLRLLARFEMFPVCHPDLLGQAARPQTPAELRGRWLLHEDDGGNWKRWLAAAGVDAIEPERGLYLGGAQLTIEAAAAGNGISLGDDIVCARDFALGNLMRLFDIGVAAPGAYYLVANPARVNEPRQMLFVDWVQERMRRTLARSNRL